MKQKIMKMRPSESRLMWAGIEEDAFLTESNIEDVNIADYNLENMTYFFANTNYFRQVIRLSDGLKPVVRRTMYQMYRGKAYGGSRMKSGSIIGDTLKIHAHNDVAIYEAMVGLAQQWKTPVPLIRGRGNFGNEKDDPVAAYRYTEASLSKYGYECFFSDYDPDCIEKLHNTAADVYEPMSLPTKFPNILVNGGTGLAPCNTFRVPPFNIDDIIKNTKRVLANPDCGDVYMIPDLPTGCPIVDSDGQLDSIVETGKGTLRMRADIDIQEVTVNHTKYWALCVKNIPWMVSLRMVRERLVSLKAKGQLPFEDIQDYSYQVREKDGRFSMQLDFRILISYAHDPYAFRNKIWKLTDLDKGVAVDLKAVVDELKVRRFPLKMLIQSWIDERRSYKRRLYNKRLLKINERIDLLRVLITALDDKNINRTIKTIRRCRNDDLYDELSKICDMTRYQAMRLSESKLNTLTAEERQKYLKELPERIAERDELIEIIGSERKIDQIIADELDDLKKYASPRKSRVIRDSDAGETIADTMHTLVVTNQGYVKKLPFYRDDPKKNHNFGVFNNMDYPISAMTVHNRDSVLFFDSYGRYSSIDVHMIDTCEPSHCGYRIYDFTKLNGKIVQTIPGFKESQLKDLKARGGAYLITLTSDGYIKKTALEEYLKVKGTRNIRAVKVREGDSLVYAALMVGNPNVIIYTKKGKYLYTSMDAFDPTGKDTAGLMSLKLEPGDSCIGVSLVKPNTDFIGVVTEKGLVKKCELAYFGDVSKRRASPSYLVTLDSNDNVHSVFEMSHKDDITVVTTQGTTNLDKDKIPVMSRKAKGSKMISVPLGAKIIRADATHLVKH